jgi:hypothetical protein
MKIKFLYILIFVTSVAFSQIATTSALAPTITNAGQGDLYLSTDTSQLYIGLSNGKVSLIGNEGASGWGLTGNSNALSTSLLGTINDVKMNIGSNNTSILEFGKRSTLGLVQAYTDYTDPNQYLVHLKGGGVSALQFEASAASFYKPMFFTTTDGNFRLKGSAAGSDFFEIGSAGTSALNNGSLEFIVGDDGDEPIVFKKFNYSPASFVEMMRIQGTGLNNSVRVGINTNGVAANSVLQVGGSLSLPIRSVTGNTIIDDNDYTVILKPPIPAGSYSGTAVTLPVANTCAGRIYIVKNFSGAPAKNVSQFKDETGSNNTTLSNSKIYSFQSDGADWQLISKF